MAVVEGATPDCGFIVIASDTALIGTRTCHIEVAAVAAVDEPEIVVSTETTDTIVHEANRIAFTGTFVDGTIAVLSAQNAGIVSSVRRGFAIGYLTVFKKTAVGVRPT